MDFVFNPEYALPLAEHLYHTDTRQYDRLIETLEEIAADPEDAKLRRSQYVSTRKVWATHIPSTSLTAYWRVVEPNLVVVHLLSD